MSRKSLAWFVVFLNINLVGNYAVVCDQQYRSRESKLYSKDISQGQRVTWTARLQRYGISSFKSDFYPEFALDTADNEEIFMTRHLLSASDNASTNATYSQPASLSRGQKIAFTLGYIFVMLVGLFGDLLILIVIAINKELHNNLNLLLCHLVVVDLLRMVITASFELFMINRIGNAVSHIPADPGFTGRIFCKSMFGLSPIFTFAFVFTLIFMTSERFVAVVFPFRVTIFKNKSKWIILCVWLASIILGIPGLYAFDSLPFPGSDDYFCGIDFSPHCDGNGFEDRKCTSKIFKRFLSASVYITFVVAFLFILSLHAIMAIVLYKDRPKFNPESSCVSKTVTHSTRDVVRMLGVMSIVYVVTSLPGQIYQFGYIYNTAWLNKSMPTYFNFLLIFLGNLHSMFYPWIYPLLVKRFRQKYAKLFRTNLLCNQTRSQSDASTRSGRSTMVTNDLITNKLICKNSNDTQF